jgi:CBS domain containing-hemolysin-like protein
MGRDPEAEEDGDGINTESLAALIVEELERTPAVGDAIDLPIGRLRVEQLARSRITRVGVYLKEPLAEPNP